VTKRGACEGVRSHTPEPAEVDRHHTYPTYLCSALGIPKRRETVLLCSGCHDLVHHILHHLISEGSLGGHHPSAPLSVHIFAAWRWWQEQLIENTT
jgi:hypothetical protein